MTSEEKKSIMYYVIATETEACLFVFESLGIILLPVDFWWEGICSICPNIQCTFEEGCGAGFFFFGHPCSCDTVKELKLGFPGFNLFSNKTLTEYSPSHFLFYF